MSRFTHFVHRITLAAVLNIAWSSAAHAQPAWVPTDIGTFGGSEAVARAVNNHGVVVGDSDLPGNSARHIFLWTAGDGMVDIGTMGGVTAYGMDINDAGQVVGFGDLAGGTHLHAFVWSAATGFTDICEGQAHAINNRGMVVGECVGRGPIMWTASEGIVNLGSIPGVVNGSYSATDVNEAGTVVGTVVTHAHIEDTIPRPFIWTRAGGMAFVEVGVEGGYGPYINNRGDIAMGFNLWPHDGGGRVFLGFPAGGLNNRGQIVEERSYSSERTPIGVWSADRNRIELGSIFGEMGTSGINDAGLIAGWATRTTFNDGLGYRHAIVWQPREDLAIDFGPDYGTWRRAGTTYTPLHGRSAAHIITGDLDGSGTDDLIIDFGEGVGVWAAMNNNDWIPIHGMSPSLMIAADLDGDLRDELVCVFPGAGLWYWRQGIWTQLHHVDATALAVAQLDGTGGKDLIVSLPGYGIYAWQNDSAWVQIHPLETSIIVVGDLDGNTQDDLVIDFPGAGLWGFFNNSVWRGLEAPNASHIAAGDIDGNGYTDLVVDFGRGQGVWIYRNGALWVPLHPLSVESLTLADLDGNGQDEVVIDFGPSYGLWQYANDTNWEFLHGLSPGAIAAAVLH